MIALPDELLFAIFRFIPPRDFFFTLPLVGKQWRRCSRPEDNNVRVPISVEVEFRSPEEFREGEMVAVRGKKRGVEWFGRFVHASDGTTKGVWLAGSLCVHLAWSALGWMEPEDVDMLVVTAVARHVGLSSPNQVSVRVTRAVCPNHLSRSPGRFLRCVAYLRHSRPLKLEFEHTVAERWKVLGCEPVSSVETLVQRGYAALAGVTYADLVSFFPNARALYLHTVRDNPDYYRAAFSGTSGQRMLRLRCGTDSGNVHASVAFGLLEAFSNLEDLGTPELSSSIVNELLSDGMFLESHFSLRTLRMRFSVTPDSPYPITRFADALSTAFPCLTTLHCTFTCTRPEDLGNPQALGRAWAYLTRSVAARTVTLELEGDPGAEGSMVLDEVEKDCHEVGKQFSRRAAEQEPAWELFGGV